MPIEWSDLLRDIVVLAYMFLLRVGVPLLITFMVARWIQRKLAEQDLAEERARRGKPHCWDLHTTPQTRRAQFAAEAHPEIPCWLAVQAHGDGLTEQCFECPRYRIEKTRPVKQRVEANQNEP